MNGAQEKRAIKGNKQRARFERTRGATNHLADSCVHSPHDDPSCLCGSCEDQIVGIWCFVLCRSRARPLKASMVLPSVNQQVFRWIRKKLSSPERWRMQVTNLLLVTPALIRFSAILNDGASIVGFLRTKNQKRSASVIDTSTGIAINEHEDMEGEFAG